MNRTQVIELQNAYQSVVQGVSNWLLLCYTDDLNLKGLALCGQGAQGLEELKYSFRTHVLQHAVYRQDLIPTSKFIMVTYMPNAALDDQRTRALTNAQRIAGFLQPGCEAFLTIQEPSELTHEFIHRALLAQRYTTSMHRSSSEFAASSMKPLSRADPMRRTSSEPSAPNEQRLKPPSTFFSRLLRKHMRVDFSSTDISQDVPPAPPPKDQLSISIKSSPAHVHHVDSLKWEGSDCASGIASHPCMSNEAQGISSHPSSPSLHIPLRGKWAAALFSNPSDRARIRMQVRLDRQREEEEAVEGERRRQAEIQRRRQEAIVEELEDEARRKTILEEDLKRAAAERRRREYIEKTEEERLRHLLELKRRVEKEKRLVVHRQMEQWRGEQMQMKEEERRELEEMKFRQLEQRKQRISLGQARLQRDENYGWVTIQTNESVVWKRRFFKLDDGKLSLYRDSEQSLNQPTEEIDIRKQVRNVKEWDEGYEELEAIASSFVMELVGQGKAWMMYADNEEDKYAILGYIYQSHTVASMAGLISPKPVSYLQQHAQYNPYARGISAYSETPPIAAPLAHPVPHQPVNQYLASAGGNAQLGVHEEGRIHSLVVELLDPNMREGALLELSKKREQYEDLALVLWHSFGIMPALLQEIVSVYPLLSPPNLTAHISNRVCNALALLQCVASHTETRQLFLNAHIPLFLYPFLNTTSKTRPFEYLRLTSLGVIGALVKQNDNNTVIHFLLSTEIIPLCLRIMETGSELSKTVAIFIVQKILLDETGLTYICHTYERFYAVGTVLSNMVNQLVETQAVRLLKHVVRCYLRLSDNLRAREALRACLPEPLRDQTFSNLLKGDMVTKRCLTTLLNNLNEP
ncbi:hypothetical protein APHAL10511_004455 [Amanita phalloides]|nr:hypothetical protein APHAL10511_004455 [Amanita phalloides]